MDVPNELTPPPCGTPSHNAGLRPPDVSKERLQTLLEVVDAIIWEADAETQEFTFVSLSVQRLLGFAPTAWTSTPNFWTDHVHPVDRERAEASRWEALEKGRAISEYRFQGADAQFRWFRDSMQAAENTKGGGRLLRGVMAETTRQQEVEQALRESEERYRLLFNEMGVGFALVEVIFDENGNPCDYRDLELNPASEKLTGISRAETLGRTVKEAIPGIEPFWIETYGRVAKTGESVHFENYAKFLDKWFEVTAFRTDQGRVAITFTNITQRKRTEALLRQSEERYRRLFEAESDAVLVVDSETGRILDVNAAALPLYGHTREEFLELTARDVSAEPAKTADAIANLQTHVELRYHKKRDGTVFPVEIAGNYFQDQGRSVHVAAIRDISARQRAEEALRQSEDRFRNLIEQAPVGISFIRNGLYVYANRKFLGTFGYGSMDEIVGRPVEELFAPANRAAIEERARLRVQGVPVPSTYETMAQRKDGTPFPVQMHVTLVSLPDGPAILGFTTDITERRRAEEALRDSEAQLRQAERLAHLGSSTWDVTTDETRWSDELYRIMGRDPSEKAPRHVQRAQIYTPESWLLLEAAINRTLATGEAYDLELEVVRPDGTTRWTFGRGIAVRNEEGRVVRLHGTLQDITEQKRARSELERSLDQVRALAARLQSVREEESKRLARELHDQLGQVLTALRLDISSTVTEMPVDAQVWARHATSLLGLVDETLHVVRRICGELRPEMLDDLGLVATLEWAVEEFRERTKIACLLDLPPEDLALEPERATAIYRIFQEILTNVARHAEARQVKVLLEQRNQHIVLVVHDDGQGIPAEKLTHRDSLGLLGMQERALAVGGEITIFGAPGTGTTVRLRVPMTMDGGEEPAQ